MKYKLFDVVRLLKDFSEEGVFKGEVAAIVEVYTNPMEGYELEFVGEGGITKALFAVRPDDIELAGR
ncbi:hypothetical protein PAECIP111891_04569 [Paenibacillus allorhizoplanae]|uniref:DUF4926 domain-containing protein n=1 Tax=Paenibacillus allorhizoplanae TaxID=2905648 RepID=A0ABM9CNE9_9BACL|nr:DUF4926 domain-containing protein [Paenibacillus allorhizoplanae]CAH1217463.1 hypothetical protein PAECIP111891_04569 [Paenibacillus allorhizoplanae]